MKLNDEQLKRNKCDFFVSLLLLLCLNLVAVISLECCIVAFLVFPVIISSLYIYHAKKKSRTNFFFFFNVLSGIYLLALFEVFVPLMELLPQENFIFISLIFITVFLFSKVYRQASLNKLGPETSTKEIDSATVTLIVAEEKANESDDENDPADDRNSCPTCRKYIPARTYHCFVCKSCIIARDHHNFFLNCCVGRFNHKAFLLGCITCISALVLFANLSLTSICHPFPVFRIFGVNILLPDDCGDVFQEIELALCFVGAIYALQMSIALLIFVIQQFILIARGATSMEYWTGNERRRKHNCCRNLKNFWYI